MKHSVITAVVAAAVLIAYLILRPTVQEDAAGARPISDQAQTLDDPVTGHAALERPEVRTERGEITPAASVHGAPSSQGALPLPAQEVTEAARSKAELEILTQERDRTYRLLDELSAPILKARLDAGTAEFVSTESKYSGRKGDSTEVFAVFMVPNKGTFRASVSREERPDLYVLKDQLLELNSLVRKAEQSLASEPKK